MGRRLKLTPELQEELCTLIERGCHVQIACLACDISTSSFYAWLQQGEREAAEREAVAVQEEWITTSQAADLAGLPVAELRKVAKAGEFKAKKQRGRWLLERTSLLLWAEPEGSPYLQFLAAVRRAEAEAEVHLVEFWQEQTPKDWRAARDLLARRFPERWAERKAIEADVRSSSQVQADVAISGEVEVSVEPSGLKRVLLEFRDFMLYKAIEWEQMSMDIQELLGDGQPRDAGEIARAIGQAQEKTLQRLQDMARSGQVKREGDLWVSTWTPTSTGDDQGEGEELPTPEPFPEIPPWEPPAPGPPPRRAPIVAGKFHGAKLRNGELEESCPRPAFLFPDKRR